MSLIETRVQQALQAMAGNPYAGYAFATMSDGYIKASAMYLGGTLGMSYKINDMFSVALAGRYVSAAKAYEGQGDFTTVVVDTSGTTQYGTVSRVLDVEKKASGFNGIIGIDIAPMENLNIGLRYETATELEFETTVTQNDWAMFFAPDSSFTDGYMERRDLPAVFSGGISYAFTPELTVSAMYNRFFVTTEKDDNAGIDSMYVDGSDIAFGIDYLVSPGILLSVGYLHSDNGGCDVVYEDSVPNLGTYSEFEYSLNSDAIGGGVKYSINENMAFTLAGGHNFYKEGLGVYPDLTGSEGKFNKSATYFALGAEMSF